MRNGNTSHIYLAPFCAESVLVAERLHIDNLEFDGFFDKNPLLRNKNFGQDIITNYYFAPNTTVIVCSEKFEEDITATLLRLGYASENIKSYKDITLEANVYEAAARVNINLFQEFMPAQLTLGDDSGVLKLRKLRRLHELGAIENSLNYEDFEGMWRKDNYLDAEGKRHLFIKRFELDVTSRCSLNCKHCGAMMQYFTEPYDIDTESINNDYNRMLEVIEWTDDVLIMGGEPLLKRGLEDVIRNIHANPNTEKKVGIVRIVTNGTIIPEGKVLEAIKESNVCVWISNYREHSRRIVELVKVLSENDISFEVLALENWADVQQLIPDAKPLTREELLEKRKSCWKRHHAVSEGRFYLCAFANSANRLHAVPHSDDNYVDIYKDDVIDRIYKYLSQDEPLPIACSWCNGNNPAGWSCGRQLPVAEQAPQKLTYTKF